MVGRARFCLAGFPHGGIRSRNAGNAGFGAVDRPGSGDPAVLRQPVRPISGSVSSPGRPVCRPARCIGCCWRCRRTVWFGRPLTGGMRSVRWSCSSPTAVASRPPCGTPRCQYCVSSAMSTGETAAVHELLPTGQRVVLDQVESHHQLRRTYTEFGIPVPLPLGAPGQGAARVPAVGAAGRGACRSARAGAAADHHRPGGAGRPVRRDPGARVRPVDDGAHAGHPERRRAGVRLLRPGRRMPERVRPRAADAGRAEWRSSGCRSSPPPGRCPSCSEPPRPPANAVPLDRRSVMSRPEELWKIAPSVYLPALLYGIGQGAIAPVVAVVRDASGRVCRGRRPGRRRGRARAGHRRHPGRCADQPDR